MIYVCLIKSLLVRMHKPNPPVNCIACGVRLQVSRLNHLCTYCTIVPRKHRIGTSPSSVWLHLYGICNNHHNGNYGADGNSNPLLLLLLLLLLLIIIIIIIVIISCLKNEKTKHSVSYFFLKHNMYR